MDMTQKETKAVAALRNRGYAVIIWTPEEIGTVNPRRLEDRSVELGWEVIEDLKDTGISRNNQRDDVEEPYANVENDIYSG